MTKVQILYWQKEQISGYIIEIKKSNLFENQNLAYVIKFSFRYLQSSYKQTWPFSMFMKV